MQCCGSTMRRHEYIVGLSRLRFNRETFRLEWPPVYVGIRWPAAQYKTCQWFGFWILMKAVHYILYTWLALTNYDKRVKRNVLSILKRCVLNHFVKKMSSSSNILILLRHPSSSFVILLPSSSRGESAPWVFQDGPARIAALRPSTSTGTNSELRGFDVLTFMKCCKML